MEILDYDSSIVLAETAELPTSLRMDHEPPPLHALQSQPESITVSMENSDHDSNILTGRDGQIVVSIRNEEHTAHDLQPIVSHNYDGLLYLLHGGSLVLMYPSLTQLVQLKFQNNSQSPFETLSFLINTAVVAYSISVPTSLILLYMRTRLEISNNEHFSIAYYVYMILKYVFCFFAILAPLSLLIVLLLPSHV